MEKNDIRSLGISLILNLFIILLLPGIRETIVDTAKISVGFVELKDENRKITPKKTEKESVEKTIPQVKQEIKVQEENLEPVKKTESKPVKIESPDFEMDILKLTADIPKEEKTISIKKDIMNNKLAPQVKTTEKLLVTEGELKGQEKPKEVEQKKINSIVSEKEIAGSIPSKENGKEKGFKSIAEGSDEKLPAGIKVGSKDGDLVPGWDRSNKDPIYPQSVLEKGLFGKVTFRLDIGIDGEIKSLVLITGSGVPEINRAVEELVRTWKIHLSKNGLRMKGTVVLEYDFSLIDR